MHIKEASYRKLCKVSTKAFSLENNECFFMCYRMYIEEFARTFFSKSYSIFKLNTSRDTRQKHNVNTHLCDSPNCRSYMQFYF